MGNTCGLIFGLVFAGVGLFLLIRGITELRVSKASTDWPFVEGQVTVATVEMKIDSSDSGTSRKYAPRVVYTYSVSSQQYTSDQVVIGSKRWYSFQAKAETKLAYQAGQQVTVYYNPDDPAQALLEAGATRGAWGTIVGGLIFTAIGIIVVVTSASRIFTG